MPEGPGVFSLGQIVLSAAIGTVASFVVVWLFGRWARDAAIPVSESVVLAVFDGGFDLRVAARGQHTAAQ